jgi:hypothetical protein
VTTAGRNGEDPGGGGQSLKPPANVDLHIGDKIEGVKGNYQCLKAIIQKPTWTTSSLLMMKYPT